MKIAEITAFSAQRGLSTEVPSALGILFGEKDTLVLLGSNVCAAKL
jgi:hypothetical protein